VDKLNFFEEGSPYLAHPLLTGERTEKEIDFVESELALRPGARLLDMGCGFGRHSLELARRGYDVVGVDPSGAMIKAALQTAEEATISVEFRRERGEQFTTETPFDAAICLFTSLGQISAQGENNDLVQQVGAALKPGGQFMVEVPQRDATVRQLKASDKFGDGERYTAVSRHFDHQNHSATEIFRLVSPEYSQTYTLRYRLYDRGTLLSLLTDAGFTVQSVFGNYEGEPLTDEHLFMLVVGQKG
jgi:cyclopropane fatty-acyl-phospholipid synthase-like methyltransferase